MNLRIPRIVLLLTALFSMASCGNDPEGMVWRYQSVRRLLPFSIDHTMNGIQVVGDLVVFCGGDGWKRTSHLGAVRLRDGVPMWRHKVGWCTGNPQIVDSIAVGWGHQPEYMSMKAANIGNGILLWRRAFDQGLFQYQDPVAFGKHVYLPSAGELHQVTATRGYSAHAHGEGCVRTERSWMADRKSTRLNSSHLVISYAVF